jgi:hypothetical protein
MLLRRLLISLYLGSVQAFDAAGGILHACFNGFWLAVLSKHTLDVLDDSFYRRASWYISDARTLGGLMPWEEAAIDKYFGCCSALLVTGAGAGREVIALHQRGYGVDGFECNDKLLKYGNELFSRIGIPSSLQPMNRDECPSINREYDGIIVGWSSYMHIQGRSRRVAFLRELRCRVHSGSPMLLSFFCRGANAAKRDHLGIAALVANVMTAGLRSPRIDTGDALSPMYVHYFSESEITRELHDGGFELVEYSVTGYGHAIGIAC